MRTSRNGQLLLPMVTLLFFFGIFFGLYARWCRAVYWKMRMDTAADCAALSAAREEAAILNDIATAELAENGLLAKVGVGRNDLGVMQTSAKSSFDNLNLLMRSLAAIFPIKVADTALAVARANGADGAVLPLTPVRSMLKSHGASVALFSGIVPSGAIRYDGAYFTRDWSPRQTAPQPPHKSWWRVCHGSACEQGRAAVWLDVHNNFPLMNGGFPSEDASLWKKMGMQCFYPQFAARRERKS